MAPEFKTPPELLLPPPLSRDARSRAFTASVDRLLEMDRSVLLVMMVDLVSPEVLPYLAQHFGLLGPPWRYLKTDEAKRKGIKEAIYWHRLKGSPAAVERALSWADIKAEVEDLTSLPTRWAEYELVMESLPGNLPELKELADFADPARAHLVRLHNGYDLRPIILDRGPVLDLGMLDNDSGVWDEETGLKLSFGDNWFMGLLPFYPNGEGPWCWIAGQAQLGMSSRYRDRVVLDHWRLDSAKVRNYPIAGKQEMVLVSDQNTLNTGSALQLRREISKSQMALDAVKPDCLLHTLDRPWDRPSTVAGGDGGQEEKNLCFDELFTCVVSARAKVEPVVIISAIQGS